MDNITDFDSHLIELMPHPAIGSWYQTTDKKLFKIIALDEDAIEIQYFDGDIEAIDPENWQRMGLRDAEEPEDWSGPFDDLEHDDLGYDDTGYRAAGYDPLAELE